MFGAFNRPTEECLLQLMIILFVEGLPPIEPPTDRSSEPAFGDGGRETYMIAVPLLIVAGVLSIIACCLFNKRCPGYRYRHRWAETRS
jgi:hypothetical protein